MMTFLARMKVKEGKVEEFERLARKMTRRTLADEPGVKAYEFFRLHDEERGYAVFESFASEEAEEAHRNSAHFNELAPALIECIDGTYVREFLDHLD